MIVQLREQTDYRTPTLAVREDDGTWHEFEDDEIAEVITLPGDQVQVIDMEGERNPPIVGTIIMVTGMEFSVWVAQHGETTRHDNESHVQQNPNGSVARTKDDGHTELVGTEIRRAKRTALLNQ